ncbi:MAG: plasmid mobilization protein [Acidimicrobiales bacterium]
MTKKDKMVSVRFTDDELDRIRPMAEAQGKTLSQFIRSAARVPVPRPKLDLDSWFVPYGFGGMNGNHFQCRVCGVETSGPSDPIYAGHIGGCSELKKVERFLELQESHD